MPIKKLLLATIILLITMTSCGPISNTMPTQEAEGSLPITKSVSGDQTFSSEGTSVPAPNLMTPTAFSQNIRFQCLKVLSSKPNNLGISGHVILRDYQQNGMLFALDVSNGHKAEILRSSGPHTIAAISPDRQLLAYRDNVSANKEDKLIIADSHFVSQKSTPWQLDWLTIVNWVNNKQLALLNNNPEASMVIFDWITGQEMPISFNQYPDFSNSVRNPWVEFDPTMQRVLYPVIGDKNSLFDLTNQESIAMLPSWTTETPDASWTQDGEFVAVIGPSPNYYDNLGGSDEIFVINRNGQVEQITHLADYYGRNLGLYSPSWSPNGKQLVFWLQHESNGTQGYVLAIVDTITRVATNLCISSDPSGYGGEFHEALPPPIWSPDGKQIIVESRISDDYNRVILIELSNMIAFEIAKDARPVGWMATQP